MKSLQQLAASIAHRMRQFAVLAEMRKKKNFARGDMLQKVGKRALMDQGYLMPQVRVPLRAHARLSPQLKQHADTQAAKAAKWLRNHKGGQSGAPGEYRRPLPAAGPDDYKPRVLKTVPAIQGVAGTGPQWSVNQKKFDAILARYEFGDRARNPQGQYAPGNDVSVDDMADAYGKKKKAALIVGAGGATVAAAMAGRKYAPQMAGNIAPAIGRVLRRAVM
jgi:hypothetical protein